MPGKVETHKCIRKGSVALGSSRSYRRRRHPFAPLWRKTWAVLAMPSPRSLSLPRVGGADGSCVETFSPHRLGYCMMLHRLGFAASLFSTDFRSEACGYWPACRELFAHHALVSLALAATRADGNRQFAGFMATPTNTPCWPPPQAIWMNTSILLVVTGFPEFYAVFFRFALFQYGFVRCIFPSWVVASIAYFVVFSHPFL